MDLRSEIQGLQWKRPAKCEAGHCPEVAVFGNGMIGIRSSTEPEKITWLNEFEWNDLVAEMRSECPFGISDDRAGYVVQ